MGQVKVGPALLGAAMLAQLAIPAVTAATDHPALSPVQPLALLDAQEMPPPPDDEPLDQENPAADQPPVDQQPAEQPAPDAEAQIPAGATDTQAPVDDTELGDQGGRPVDQPTVSVPGGSEPVPADASGPGSTVDVTPVPAGPVAAEPVPAGPVDVTVGDSYSQWDSYGYTDSYEQSWPFMYGGSVFVNAGYGPGEANAETGYDSCENRVTNGRAYVGVHCDGGNVVAGFTPPPWAVTATPAAGAGLLGSSGNDDFWSRVTGEGGVVKVPVPGATTAPADAKIVEGRSRERTKTVTITRNGESETVTHSGKNNSTDTPKDSKNGNRNGNDNGKNGNNNNKKKNNKSAGAKADANAGAARGGKDSGDGKSSQDLASDKHGRKHRKHHKPEREQGVAAEQTAGIESGGAFAACVQQSIQHPGVNLHCGDLISTRIGTSLGLNAGK